MLTRRTLDQPRPIVTVDAAIGQGLGPHKERFHSYLGVVAREKVPIVHNNWKDVPDTLKELVWNDILAKFDIPKALHAKKKDQHKEDPSVKYGFDAQIWEEFAATRKTPNWQGIRKKMQEIKKNNDCPHFLSRGGYDLLEKKLLDEKIKKRQHDALMTENPALIEDPPSPIKRHVKWKMARTNRYGKMTSEAARQIADKIDSLEEQVTQGEFVPQGRQDILNMAIGRPNHGGRVRVAGSGVTISQYYGRTSLRNEIEEEKKRSLEAWKNELKDAIITDIFNRDKVSAPANFHLNVLGARVSTKESNVEIVVNPSGEEHVGRVTPPMGLYVQSQDCTKLVALGKIQDGPSTIHCIAYADDVIKHSGITPNKVVNATELNNDVPKQDPLCELIKTLVEIYDKPVEFVWDLTEFGIPNVNSSLFLRYIDDSEITSSNKCLNIAILQLWTMYMNEWSNGLGPRSVYGFLEPQSIHNAKDRHGQCEEYIEKWLKESQQQLYIGAYLNEENEASLAVLPDLLMELDSMDEVDDFDAFKQRMLGIGDKKPPPYRRDLLFVDNAGADTIWILFKKKIYLRIEIIMTN
ncbi:Pantothenate kinase 2 [Glycine soja]